MRNSTVDSNGEPRAADAPENNSNQIAGLRPRMRVQPAAISLNHNDNRAMKSKPIAGKHTLGVAILLAISITFPAAAQNDPTQQQTCSALEKTCLSRGCGTKACPAQHSQCEVAYQTCVNNVVSYLTPRYLVTSLIYAPPGASPPVKNPSSIVYTTSTQVGTTLSIANSLTTGWTVSAGYDSKDPKDKDQVGSVNAGINFGASDNQTTTTITSTAHTSTDSTTWNGKAVDGIDHAQDLIVLWVNPRIKVTTNELRKTVSWSLELNPDINQENNSAAGQAIYEYVTVNALKNPQSMDPGLAVRFNQVYHITSDDIANILSTDPFAYGDIDPNFYPARFLPILDFPDRTYASADDAEDQTPGTAHTINNMITKTTQYSEIKTTQGDLSAGVSLGPFSLGVDNTLTITQSTLRANNTIYTSIAAATIWGPSVAYSAKRPGQPAKPSLLATYQDAIFGTILFHLTGPTEIPQLTGVVTNLQGVPVPSLRVSLEYEDGTIIPTYTDYQGGYEFYEVPAGSAQLMYAGKLTLLTVPTAPGQLIRDLTIPSAPAIARVPASTETYLGGPATFSVAAAGAGLSYQWLLNGNLVAGATASSLTIPVVGAKQAGSYSVVVASGPSVVRSSTAQLTIIPPPVITSNPASTGACLSQPAVFSVAAQGASPHYQWRKNGNPLGGAFSPSLAIDHVNLEDQGFYDVVVTDSVSQTASSLPATLTVNDPTISISSPTGPSSVARLVGQSVTFSVTATGTNLQYQWRGKNGGNIPGATGSSYTIPSVSLTDVGPYYVVVFNGCGMVNSVATTLTVSAAVANDDSSFVVQSVPVTITGSAYTMQNGQPYNVSMTFTNIGTSTWTSAGGYKLVSQRPTNFSNTWGISQVDLPASVAPGGQVTFKFTVTAPNTSGLYDFEWVVEHNSVNFGDFSPDLQITVK